MDEGLHVNGSVTIPRHELTWRFSRASGPGGQGVNTTDSRVQLSWDLAGSPSLPDHLRTRAVDRLGPRLVDGCVVVVAAEQRSQLQNREAAERRLVQIVQDAIAPPPRRRRPTKPTRAAKEKRLKGKKVRSEVKRMRRTPE